MKAIDPAELGSARVAMGARLRIGRARPVALAGMVLRGVASMAACVVMSLDDDLHFCPLSGYGARAVANIASLPDYRNVGEPRHDMFASRSIVLTALWR